MVVAGTGQETTLDPRRNDWQPRCVRGHTRTTPAATLAALALCACSSSATVTLRDGRRVEGRILESDARTIRVDQSSIGFSEAPIGRDVIVELESGEELTGKLTPDTRVGGSSTFYGRIGWERVCVEPSGGSAQCVQGDTVMSLSLAPLALNRGDISDVSHPGSGEMGVGVGILAFGAFLLVPQLTEGCGRGPTAAGCAAYLSAAVLLFGVPGLVLTTDGLITHLGSRSRFAPPDAAAVPTSNRRARGVALSVAF